MNIFRVLIEHNLVGAYFYVKIFRVLTERGLISGYFLMNILRVVIQLCEVGGYQTSRKCAASNFFGKMQVCNSELLEFIYQTTRRRNSEEQILIITAD
jgi:hypothetical protein